MMDDFYREQVQRIRVLAEKADPFIKKRLLDLADRYEAKLGKRSPAVRTLKVPTLESSKW